MAAAEGVTHRIRVSVTYMRMADISPPIDEESGWLERSPEVAIPCIDREVELLTNVALLRPRAGTTLGFLLGYALAAPPRQKITRARLPGRRGGSPRVCWVSHGTLPNPRAGHSSDPMHMRF